MQMACQFLQHWGFGWIPTVPLKRFISWKQSLNTLSSKDSVTRSPNPGSVDPNRRSNKLQVTSITGLQSKIPVSVLSSSVLPVSKNVLPDVLLYCLQHRNHARRILLVLFLMLRAHLEGVTSISGVLEGCVERTKLTYLFILLDTVTWLFQTTKPQENACCFAYLMTCLISSSYTVLIWYLYHTVGLTCTVDESNSVSVLQNQCVEVELLKFNSSRKSPAYQNVGGGQCQNSH